MKVLEAIQKTGDFTLENIHHKVCGVLIVGHNVTEITNPM